MFTGETPDMARKSCLFPKTPCLPQPQSLRPHPSPLPHGHFLQAVAASAPISNTEVFPTAAHPFSLFPFLSFSVLPDTYMNREMWLEQESQPLHGTN